MSLLRSIPALWRNGVATMLQYRGEIFLWAVWGIIYPAVSMAMWAAAAEGSSTPGEIQGYDRAEFAAYFLLTMIVGHLCTAWDAYEMGYYVRSGRISPQLLRPILPMWSSVANNIAYKFVTLAMLIPIWIVAAWITRPAFHAGPGQVCLGALATIMGAALSYLWGYNVACLAFWTTRVDAIAELWFGGSLIFGGRLAPLALLPGLLESVTWLMPFRWMVWFPCETLSGNVPVSQAATGLLWQLAWFAAGIFVFRFIWRAGLRKYSAVGA